MYEDLLKKKNPVFSDMDEITYILREKYNIDCIWFKPSGCAINLIVLRLDGIYFYGAFHKQWSDLVEILEEIQTQEKIQQMKKRKIRDCIVSCLKQFEKSSEYTFSVSIGEKKDAKTN